MTEAVSQDTRKALEKEIALKRAGSVEEYARRVRKHLYDRLNFEIKWRYAPSSYLIKRFLDLAIAHSYISHNGFQSYGL